MAKLKFVFVFFTTALGILFLAAWVIPRSLLSNDDNIERLAKGDPQAVEYAREVRWLIGHAQCSQLAALRCTGVKIVEF